MTMTYRALGVPAVVASAMLWGTTGTVQALLPAGKVPVVVGAFRLLFGAATLVCGTMVMAEARAAVARMPLGAAAAAGFAIALYNMLFFVAVQRAGVGIGTALAIGSAPLWVAGYEAIVRRRLPSRRRLIGQMVSIAGAGLLIVSGSALQVSPSGMLLATLAGSAYASYALITGAVDRSIPAVTVAAVTFTFAALLCSPMLLVFPTGWALAVQPMALLLFIGIFVTGLSYALYTWALRSVPASTAVTLSLIEPLTAWLLATTVVGEPLSPLKVAGAAALLIGLWIVTSATKASDPQMHWFGGRPHHSTQLQSEVKILHLSFWQPAKAWASAVVLVGALPQPTSPVPDTASAPHCWYVTSGLQSLPPASLQNAMALPVASASVAPPPTPK